MTQDSGWLQITSGQGPEECALAVKKITDIIMLEANQHKIETKIIAAHPDKQPGTYLSVLIHTQGEAVSSFMNRWQGTILWICPSPFRPGHKRKNWFIGIDAFLLPKTEDLELQLKDIGFQTMRASGPGGQHVNTTDSAVRAIHKPTGITVTASEERSQHQNKKLALAKLAAHLEKREELTLTQAKKNRC